MPQAEGGSGRRASHYTPGMAPFYLLITESGPALVRALRGRHRHLDLQQRRVLLATEAVTVSEVT